MRFVKVENVKPDARKKTIQVRVENAILNEEGEIIGFDISYSEHHAWSEGFVFFRSEICKDCKRGVVSE